VVEQKSLKMYPVSPKCIDNTCCLYYNSRIASNIVKKVLGSVQQLHITWTANLMLIAGALIGFEGY
jgi:hypothetical protein